MRHDFTGYLLACDVDGTLACDQEIPSDNEVAMARFCAMGGRIVLATGRTPQSASPLVARYGLERYLIANNGALIYDCLTDRVVWEAILDTGDELKQVMADFPRVGVLGYCRDELVCYQSSATVEWLIGAEGLTLSERADRPNKILFGDEPEALDELEAYWHARFSDSPLSIVRASPRFTELLPPGADKGSALRRLADLLGFDREHIFVAGNYYNDVTMLDVGCRRCAPVESPPEVTAHADYIARPCREGAVADFIDHLIQTF